MNIEDNMSNETMHGRFRIVMNEHSLHMENALVGDMESYVGKEGMFELCKKYDSKWWWYEGWLWHETWLEEV